jgi:hypothetical protein
LKDAKSPIRLFMEETFPSTRPFVGAANKLLTGAETIAPLPMAGTYPYMVVGHAVDYRLRYYFAITPYQDLVAWHGASTGTTPDELFERLDIAQPFFTSLDTELARMNPVRKRLDRPDEELLVRYCYALGLYETVFRSGEIHPGLKAARDTDALLALAPTEAVEDLLRLSYAFFDGHNRLLKLPATLNPTFDGSSDIGGADADFVVGECLLDIKTTINPRLDKLWLYQLLGYLLLDYTDHYGMNAVGVYLTRQARVLRWSLNEILPALGGPNTPEVGELRERFRRLAGGLRHRGARAPHSGMIR